MEVNTFNEQFNELWNNSLAQDHRNMDIKLQIITSLNYAKDRDRLVHIGENHPYDPHMIIPMSYDGENEYITMHGDRLLLYRDPAIEYIEGRVECSLSRVVVWPATATTWLLWGTDEQVEFVRRYSEKIGITIPCDYPDH